MAHAVSASSFRSDHMSPSAVALAVLLHALVAFTLWWMSQSPPQPPAEQAIDVTFEQPKPEPPPPPPPPKPAPQPQPAPPLELGLRPPAPLTSDKPTQVPPAGEKPNEPPAPPPPPLQDVLPTPEPQPAPPTQAELAKPAPPLPAPQEQPPGAQQRQALAAPQEHAVPAPQPAKPPTPPRPQLQRPELRPSPLTLAPPHRPPAGRPGEDPSPSPFVNPADAYNRARVADNYLWQVARKLEGYRYEAHVAARQGITVVRIVIARDGRLLDVSVARSSGYPEFDRGVIAGVRAGSPYTPLPPEIQGDSATFNLPLVSINRM